MVWLLWFGSVTELRKVDPSLRSLTVGTDVIQPVDVVRDLGVYFDSHLTMKAHVARVARTCFFHLRRLRSIRRSLGRDVTARLVSALVISRLDYCNSVLTHLPASTLAPLQRVLNAAVRLVHDLGPREHVTPAMYELHWLPIAEKIKFKLCLLVHHAVNGRAPSYLTELVTSQHPRTRLSPLSWETRSGCSAFETGLIRAGVLRRCTKSVE